MRFVLKRKQSFAFALGFAIAMMALSRFGLPSVSDSGDWNVYLVVNFAGVTLAALLQALIGPHVGMFVGGPLDAISSGGATFFGVASGTWGADHMGIFFAATQFVGALVQGLVYAMIGSWLLHRWRRWTDLQMSQASEG